MINGKTVTINPTGSASIYIYINKYVLYIYNVYIIL